MKKLSYRKEYWGCDHPKYYEPMHTIAKEPDADYIILCLECGLWTYIGLDVDEDRHK